MEQKEKPLAKPHAGQWGVGIAFTVAWIGAAALYFFLSGDFKDMKPNEYGDWFAGVFSPVAFLWLVLGYFQQGEELKHSTNALILQAQELAASVKAQQQLVEVELKRIEVETSRHAAERKRQSDAVQPRLTIGGDYEGDEGDHGDVVTWSLQVHNAGHPCTHFRVEHLNGGGTGSTTLTLPLLKHDETASLAIETLRSVGVRAFVARYRDAEGVDQSQSFMGTEASDDDDDLHLVLEPLSNVFRAGLAPGAVATLPEATSTPSPSDSGPPAPG